MQAPDSVLTALKGESVSSLVGEGSFCVGHAQEGRMMSSLSDSPHMSPIGYAGHRSQGLSQFSRR